MAPVFHALPAPSTSQPGLGRNGDVQPRPLPHLPQDRLVGRLVSLPCVPGQLPVQASLGLLDEHHSAFVIDDDSPRADPLVPHFPPNARSALFIGTHNKG
jgi:hypothetical protein